jgi:DNA transformation protein
MGEKGVKLTEHATEASEYLVQKLAGLGNVSYRKMFGGYGIFESNAMFALITSEGKIHFKVDPSNQKHFEDAGSVKHGKMPYFEVPPKVLKNVKELHEWARISINIAHSSKAKK